jgi:hypothetical protein
MVDVMDIEDEITKLTKQISKVTVNDEQIQCHQRMVLTQLLSCTKHITHFLYLYPSQKEQDSGKIKKGKESWFIQLPIKEPPPQTKRVKGRARKRCARRK